MCTTDSSRHALYTILLCLFLAGSAFAQAQVDPARVTYPADQAVNVSLKPLVSWTSPSSYTYFLYVGSAPGDRDVFASGETQVTEVRLSLLPNRKYFLRLWSKIDGNWYAKDSSFTTVAAAALTTPADGAVNVDPGEDITWTPVPEVQAYSLKIGSAAGADDVFRSGETQATSLQVSVLQPSKTYYAAIWTKVGGGWRKSESSFQTGIGISHFVSPRNGMQGVDPYAPLTWTSVPLADAYALHVGTAPGLKDVYASAETLKTSALVPLTPGTHYYARIFTRRGTAWRSSDISFTTGTGRAHLVKPLDGATGVDPTELFVWNEVLDASAYVVYVGTATGLKDIAATKEQTAAFWRPVGLASDRDYFIRLWTKKGTQWLYTDAAIHTGVGIAHLLTPRDKQLEVDPATVFQWTAVPQAEAYSLWVGTTAGAKDIAAISETLVTSSAVPGLEPGVQYFAKLWTKVDGVWRGESTAFTTGSGIARLLAPTAEAEDVDPREPLEWSVIADSQAYFVYVGTSPGARDVYATGEIKTTQLSVPGLLWNRDYYVRLWTKKDGLWRFTDSKFHTGGLRARLLNPINEALEIDPFQSFSWSEVDGASSYFLAIGTQPGAADIYNSNEMPVTRSSVRPYGLMPETRYFARLWTIKDGSWRYVDSSFTTRAVANQRSRGETIATMARLVDEVRKMANDPVESRPFEGTILARVVANRGRTSADCVDFSLALAEVAGNEHIFARVVTTTLTGTDVDGHTLVEFLEPVSGDWIAADSTFGAIYYNPENDVSQSVTDINARLLSNEYEGIFVNFVTDYGDWLMRRYYVDPLVNFANIVPEGVKLASAAVNLPEAFVIESDPLTSQGVEGFYMIRFADPDGRVLLDDGGQALEYSPRSNTLWSGTTHLTSSWSLVDFPEGAKLYSVRRIRF